jgi:hypothetical protein
MLIPQDQLKLLYLNLVKESLKCEGCTVYILCANDTDSLCSLRILTVRTQECLIP